MESDTKINPNTGLCGMKVGGLPFSHLYSDISCININSNINGDSNDNNNDNNDTPSTAAAASATSIVAHQFNKQKSISHKSSFNSIHGGFFFVLFPRQNGRNVAGHQYIQKTITTVASIEYEAWQQPTFNM